MTKPMLQGGGLFTVVSRDKEWQTQPYLRDGVEAAQDSDIAKGSLEVGSLLSLEGQWQKEEKIRLPMGAET